jgi:hypothetical protein
LKNSQGGHPDVYNKSFEYYKSKVEREIKEKKENILRLKGNSREIEHLISKKVGMPSNPTQLGFDSTLRSFDSNFNNGPWKTVALSPKKNLFSTFLPPMCRSSIENLEKVENYVTRPFEQIEDVKKYIILENNFKW